jgi:hypothetical protein
VLFVGEMRDKKVGPHPKLNLRFTSTRMHCRGFLH